MWERLNNSVITYVNGLKTNQMALNDMIIGSDDFTHFPFFFTWSMNKIKTLQLCLILFKYTKTIWFVLRCLSASNRFWKKYTSDPKYWNVPVLVNTGTFFVYQYCLKMWYLHSLEHASVIQKLTILEHKNGLVLSNTCVPVSGTWSILFPRCSYIALSPYLPPCSVSRGFRCNKHFNELKLFVPLNIYLTIQYKWLVKSASISWTRYHLIYQKQKKAKGFLYSFGGKQLKCYYLLQKSFAFFCFCLTKWYFVQEIWCGLNWLLVVDGHI